MSVAPSAAALLDAVGQSVVAIDPTGTITLWNRSAERLYGRTAEEAVGRNVLDVIELAEPQPDHEEIRAAVLAGETWSGEFWTLRPDGSTVPAFATCTPVFADGQLVALVAVTTDISERKSIEAAAEADRQGLAAAQQLAHVGSCEVDLMTEVISPSEEFLRILGLDVTEALTAEIWMGAIHPADSDRVEVVRQAMYDGAPTEEVYRIVRPSGEVRWVRARAALTTDDCGVPQRVIATMLDITDLHTAEAERQEAEARFRLGFERSPIGMAMAGLDESLTVVNPALCRILGRRADEIVGRHPSEFEHAADALTARLPLRSLLDDDDALQVEHRFQRPGGEVVWVQKDMSLVRGAEDAPAYLLVQYQDITARKLGEEQLEHQALHDPLTGLPNRALLADRIKHSLARSGRTTGSVVALFLDIDHFKIVNDGMGHAAGDQLLVEVARRLQSTIRAGDTLARFGGDEFVIICDDVSDLAVKRLGARITASMQQPFRLGGREVFVTVSVGIAVAVPGQDSDSLLSNADAAMYQAKGAGRARSVVFDESMHQHASARLDIESGLRRAIEQGELRLYYQPIVDVPTESPAGLEALLRWEHPGRGIVSPLDFIPVAEDTGLIVPIGEWVLTEALTQVQSWRESVPGAEHLSIAVNLSARQLLAPNLVAVVLRAIRSAGIPAPMVHLEITESVVMNDVERSVKTLAALRALGVRLAIDDFGTGYSSLSYLKRLPVHTLKVDRSFVDGLGGNDPHDPSIVAAIISLAGALALDVVAEGVETERQLAELRRLGAQHAQGYLWSKPLPAADVPGWLTSRTALALSR